MHKVFAAKLTYIHKTHIVGENQLFQVIVRSQQAHVGMYKLICASIHMHSKVKKGLFGNIR